MNVRMDDLERENARLQAEWVELKRAESELRRSGERYRLMFFGSPDGILVFETATQKFRYANPAACQMLGYTEDELVRLTVMDIHPPYAHEQVIAALVALLRKESKLASNVPCLRKDGSVLYADITGMEIVLDGTPHTVGFLTDVTDRVRAEEDRRRLFTLSLDLLCIAGFDGRFRQVNPAWTKALGWTEEELLRGPWIDFVHPDDRDETVAAAERLASGQSVIGFENRYRGKDGAYRTLVWNSFPLPDEKLIFAVVRDETDLRKMEDRLRQAEKMEAIGQLAGGVAHDFNNQLTGILGCAETLSQQLTDPGQRRHADTIIQCAMRSADLTTQLLAFARKGKYQTTPVDVHQIIGEVSAILKRSVDKRIAIRQTLAAVPSTCMGDPTQLQNALLNLAINGCDAMPNGGELVFVTDTVTLDEAYCRDVPYEVTPGRFVRVCVTDSGTGMSDDVKAHLFEPFFTTKAPGKGTGMGLAAVYGTVRNHHGIVSIYSEPGHGSSFKIYLPLVEATVVPKPVYPVERPKGTARILLVDDEEVILDVGALALQRGGYQVLTCGSSVEALAKYRESWRDIDLVILDMLMPGLNGGELFAAMRQINPDVRALLTSGYSINGQAQSILDQGVLGFVQKPFQMSELVASAAEALRAR